MPGHSTQRRAAALLAVLLVMPPAQSPVTILSAMQAQTATGAAPAPVPATEPSWPRTYQTSAGGRVVVHQPQVSSWDDQKRLIALAAVSYSANPAVDAKPGLGTITLEADTRVSLDDRLVKFDNLRITDAHFGTLSKEQARGIVDEITRAIPENERVIALDRVLAAVDKSTIIPKDVPGLKADAPEIFVSQTPAVLVNFDNDPVWSPIDNNDLRYAVNTNWDVFEHPPTRTFYLRHDKMWLKTTDLRATWEPAGTLPTSFASLPAGDNFKEVTASLPGQKITAAQMPKVFVSFRPAELILLQGNAAYRPVPGTVLHWVANTESDLFRIGTTGTIYYLVSGRWFSAASFSGPWTFATPSLPGDFKKIPLEHERSRVLASVPGTEQAAEAVLLAQVPQTVRVSKSQAKPENVVYQGEPQFQMIDTTTVQRAVNTDKDVFLIDGAYYYCYQGVWFTGTGANGPWQVATTVPSVIYTIPASSPSYHVTYVTVEDDDDDADDWVTYAAVAGYTGLMIGWGCAVWGTGWYYPPYVGWGGYYPVYYPHFGSYGYSAWYNPWTGGYGRSAVAYGPYGGVGAGARYNPVSGTYSRGAAAWGPYGARGYGQAYNPRTGGYGQTRQGSNVYGSWGSTQVQRGDDWLSTNRVTNRATGATTRVTRTDDGGAITRRAPGPGGGYIAAGENGDIYAGRDGNAYRRQDNGSWQRYDNGGWNNVDRPQTQTQSRDRVGTSGTTGSRVDTSTYGQLERDRAARASGAERTRDYGAARSSGGTSRSTGSYRGGGMRAGGGRRR